MKKLFATFAMAALAVAGMSAQDALYICYGGTQNGKGPVAGENDPAFTYEDGKYSLDIEYSPTQESPAFKFYTKNDAGDVTYVGSLIASYNLSLVETGSTSVELEGASAMRIAKLKNEVNSAELNFTITPSESSDTFGDLVITQLTGLVVVPEAFYLWGSPSNGTVSTYQLLATLKPVEEGSSIYTATFDMPAADYDPDDVMGGTTEYAVPFWINTKADKATNGTIYLAPQNDGTPDNEAQDVTYFSFALNTGQTFSTTLKPGDTRGYTSMLCKRPGTLTVTFDYLSFEFTAHMDLALSGIQLRADGIGSDSAKNYFTIFDEIANEAFDMQVNPKEYFYGEGFELTFTPVLGYIIEVTTNNENAVEITEAAGSYTVKGDGSANGAVILIAVEEDETVTTRTVLIDFTSATTITEPSWSTVKTSFEGLEGGYLADENLEISKNTTSVLFVPALQVTFAPVEPYYISSVTASNETGVTIVEPELDEGNWVVTLTEEMIDNTIIYVRVDGETVGIEAIGVDNGVNEIYNLQGQKVANPVKGGIYIVNGKKVVL